MGKIKKFIAKFWVSIITILINLIIAYHGWNATSKMQIESLDKVALILNRFDSISWAKSNNELIANKNELISAAICIDNFCKKANLNKYSYNIHDGHLAELQLILKSQINNPVLNSNIELAKKWNLCYSDVSIDLMKMGNVENITNWENEIKLKLSSLSKDIIHFCQ